MQVLRPGYDATAGRAHRVLIFIGSSDQLKKVANIYKTGFKRDNC